MKRHLLTTLVVLLISTPSIVLTADEVPTRPLPMAKYKLPMNPKTPVVVLDFQGGFTPPRVSDEPTMSILADGSVVIPQRFANQKSFRGWLSLVELQQLLDFIIAEQKFFDYDQAAVEKKIKAAQGDGPRIAIADAPTTVIKVNANGQQKEFSRYALGIGAGKVEELARMVAVQRRLQQVMSVVSFGGQEEITKWLKLGNKELAKKFPKVKPLTAAHLQSAGERGDGSKYVSFVRNIPSADKNPSQATITTVYANIPAGADPQINVNHRQPAK